MTCPYCREAVPDGARYCPACGRDVSPGEAPTVLVEDMTRLGIPAGTPPSRPGSRPGSNPSSPSLSRTSVDFGAALSSALFSAAVYGLLYLAIEPLSPKVSLMSLQIGSVAPDFEATTTEGPMKFHEWLGNSWGVLFSHPKDFTPVCTTELGYMARLKPEFDKRNTKIIGLSVDPVDRHASWAKDIAETQGHAPNYPMIGDTDLKISKLYGMLPATLDGTSEGRTAADNMTVRNVFVIGPDKKVKLIIVYPMTTGRNFDEVLRVIDSMQLTAAHKVATPVNWTPGDDVIIAASVSDDDAKKMYPGGWRAPKPYLRIVPQPQKQ